MYRNSNIKVVLVLLIVLTVGFSIGYAYLNTSLTINGTSTVQKNTWDTHFENIKIKDGSVVASVAPAVESGTKISNFNLVLEKPGDFYEFTVDVVNAGTLDAMVSSIVKTPDLTASQQKYLDYKIEYENCVEITKKQLVKVEEFVRVKVRVEYKKDLNVADLPTELDLVSLGFEINYEQADDTGVSVLNNGVANVPVTSGDINEIGTIVTIGDQQFYTIGTEGENVKLLAMYNLYVGGEYDINTGTWTAYGSEATGLQKRTMIGYSSKSKKRGTTVFSDTYYWPDTGNYPVYVYDSNSTIYSYVENYKNYLESLGTIINEARLISAEELEHFGCTYDTQSCTNAPSFIYSTSYWSGSAIFKDALRVVFSSGSYLNEFYDGYEFDMSQGVRPVIVIPKDKIKVFSKAIAVGNINKVGTIVTIGNEQFYSIGTEGNNVKLFSKYNLYVGNKCTDHLDSSCTPYGDEATGKQASNMLGGLMKVKEKEGVTKFSNTNYWSSAVSNYPANVYNENSLLYSHVENYKVYLSTLGVVPIEARLITKEEIEGLGCSGTGCSKAPSWVYTTSYWTGTAYSSSSIYRIFSDNYYTEIGYSNSSIHGVRPVIVISKDDIIEYF